MTLWKNGRMGEEMRAIDGDALMEFVENRYDITWESDDYEGGIKDACVDILEQINKMPTIEPERKKGKWHHYESMYTCSECGASLEDISPWCPMCGADMRQGEENERD